MKNFKRVLAVLLAAVLMLSLAACASQNNQTVTTVPSETTTEKEVPESEKVNVAAIKGPTGMGMTAMTDNSSYNFELVSDPTQVVAMISNGSVDIAACPLNLAANLFNKTNGGVQMLAINTLGVLSVVTNGATVNSLSDLKDKTVYATGEGSTPEYIINYILQKNGLADSVKIEYLSEHSELTAKLVAGEVQIAILPEPFVSVACAKNSNIKSAISLTDEWETLDPSTKLAMGCVVAKSDFVKKNPEKIKKFIEDYKLSVEKVNTDTYAQMQKMIDKGIVDEAILTVPENTKENKVEAAKRTLAAEAITRCNIVFIDGKTMQEISDANLKIYFDASASSIGGKMPTSEFYYAAD